MMMIAGIVGAVVVLALVGWSVVHRIEKRRFDREWEKMSEEERRKVQEDAYRSKYE